MDNYNLLDFASLAYILTWVECWNIWKLALILAFNLYTEIYIHKLRYY